MNYHDLKELGLSEQEAKIYLALVKLGKSTANTIASEAGVSYGTIYTILSKMEREGLVKTVPEQTKKFIAAHPRDLLERIDKKEKHLQFLKKGIGTLKEIYDQEITSPVVIAQGERNFRKLVSEAKRERKRDYSLRPVFEYNPAAYRRMKQRQHEGVDCKILAGKHAHKKNMEKYRGIPMKKTSFDNVALAIYDEEVIIGLIAKNTSILIRDRQFTDMLATFFEQEFKKDQQ
jgi:sugar-specific transcriptional regulator TrmB